MVQHLLQAVFFLLFFSPKPYGFHAKNIRFWNGNHKRMPSGLMIYPYQELQIFGRILEFD